MKQTTIDTINAHRKNSGLKSIYYMRGKSVCDMCGSPIVNINTVTFKDGRKIDLGPECINRFLDMDNSIASLLKRTERMILEHQSARAILDLPEDQMPVGIALNARPDQVFHFIKDPAYKGRSISHIGHMLFSPHPHGPVHLHDPEQLKLKSSEYRAQIEVAKVEYDKLIKFYQIKRAKLLAAAWPK